MEYFSLFVIGIVFAGFVFYHSVKSKVGEIPKLSDDEAARKILSLENWIARYESFPEEKRDAESDRYREKYVELRQIQLERQKFTAVRKDIDIGEKTRISLNEYFPIAQKEIDLVKSGIDPKEARRIAYKGTIYENL
ncbi:hypothetical protein D3C84_522670 [compost metagenome]